MVLMFSIRIYKDVFTPTIANKVINLAKFHCQLKILVLVESYLVKQAPGILTFMYVHVAAKL
jgi:hypothetical protein